MVVVVIVNFVVLDFVVGGLDDVGLVVVFVIFGHKNLTLKFGQNWVNVKSYIVVAVVVVIFSVLFLLLIQKPSF